MNTVTQRTSKGQNFAVYFNAGVSAAKPWCVGTKDRRCIVESHGNFSQAETAIMHAKALAKVSGGYISIPAWLEAVA